MPSAATTSSAPRATSKRSSSINEEDQATLDTLNATIDTIRTLTAPDPYILTIPQDVEPRYHHSYQAQAVQWLHETPFRYQEGEVIQYQTFVYHEHGNGMYVLQSSRPSNDLPDGGRGTAEKNGLGANTPKDGAPKKKMSLNAYKKAKTGTGTPTKDLEVKSDNAPTAKQAAVKGPVERVKAETEEVLAAVVEEDASLPDLNLKDLKFPKWKRENDATTRDEETNKRDQYDTPVAKKARPSSTATAAAHSKPSPTRLPAQHDEMPDQFATQPLPPSLGEESSLPPKLSPLEVEPLPPRLSPTIPSNMAATLKARELLRSSSDDNAISSSALKKDKLTPIRKTDGGIVKHKSPIPKNAFRANSSSPAIRSDAEDKAVSRPAVTSAPQQHTTQHAKVPELSQDDEVAVGKILKKNRELLVRMKYRKHQREGIKRILNLRPQPDKVKTPPAQPPRDATDETKLADTPNEKKSKVVNRDGRDGSARGVAQKIGPATNGAHAKKSLTDTDGKREAAKAEKRPPTSSQPQPTTSGTSRHKKIPEAIETARSRDPSTPVQPDLVSPSLLSSAQKSQQVTPSVTTSSTKSHLMPAAVAMQRERSTESNAMAIDSPSALSTNTPVSNGHHPTTTNSLTKSSTAPTSQSTPSNVRKPPKHAVWEARQKRLESLGRDLKHAASAHLSAKAPKLAAIKSLESLLAYILAFTCADESNFRSEPKQSPETRTWRSLSAFFGFVKRNAEPYPLLYGLTCALGVVFNARILELCALHPAEGVGRDGLLETFALLHRCAGEAAGKLDVETLQTQFPKAWKARTKEAAADDKAMDPVQSFAGTFDLPIGVHTPALSAARAGYAMLQEWMDKEKIDYQLKLKL